jgi:hypothetical protein
VARPGSHHREQPRSGICGACGFEVSNPLKMFRSFVYGYGYAMWLNGHYYDEKGHLQRVRCLQHGGLGFPLGMVPATLN